MDFNLKVQYHLKLVLRLVYTVLCCALLLSDVQLFATPWSVGASLLCPWGISRQEYWSGLPCHPPWDRPNPGLPHGTLIIYCLSHKGSPRIPERVAYPFSRLSLYIPSSGDLPDPEIEQGSLALQVDSFPTELPGKPYIHTAAAAAKSRRSYLTLCDPIDGSPPGFPSLGFSRQEHWNGSPFPSPMHESGKWKMKVKLLSHVRLFATPWTVAYQAPPSMGFSRQEYWSGLPLPTIHQIDN